MKSCKIIPYAIILTLYAHVVFRYLTCDKFVYEGVEILHCKFGTFHMHTQP